MQKRWLDPYPGIYGEMYSPRIKTQWICSPVCLWWWWWRGSCSGTRTYTWHELSFQTQSKKLVDHMASKIIVHFTCTASPNTLTGCWRRRPYIWPARLSGTNGWHRLDHQIMILSSQEIKPNSFRHRHAWYSSEMTKFKCQAFCLSFSKLCDKSESSSPLSMAGKTCFYLLNIWLVWAK